MPSRTHLAILAVFVAVLAAPTVVQAHGPHHSPIRPAYDCFKYWNTETRHWHSTEGDYAISVDLDLDVYILWRCVCDWSYAYQRYFCHWREVARAREIADLPKPENNRPGDQFKTRKQEWAWVKWTAWHTGGCVVHSGRRYVWFIRRHGSEG
jgi:hypothetical protein